MKELYKLKESLVNELADYGTKGGLTASTLDTIDKLAHATKNVIKVIECCDDEEYSGNDGYSRRMSHDEERYVRPDGSYARGAGAKRDSMGRYSSESVDEHTKQELMRLIENM